MPFAWIAVAKGDKAVATAALERGFLDLALDPADASLRSLGKFRALTLSDDAVHEGATRIAARVAIRTPADQAHALALAGKEATLVVDARDWKVIPLENLIAACQGRTKLVAETASIDDAKLFLDTLEVGVDGLLFHAKSAADVRALADLLAAKATQVPLAVARVTSVRPVGNGDRVCLDTASLLAVGEGMLVGSQSGGLFLVGSEAAESPYVASRPFRVNAGAVHAYALLPGGKTRYLSELRVGDEVLAVRPDGTTRVATLGRVKIESRPLLLVEAEVGGRRLATLLQNAETVPLVGPKGPVPVTTLKPGDEVLVRLDDAARHFGMAVRETITER